MTDPEVNVNAELARLAEARAVAEGESLAELVERLLRAYVEPEG